MDGQCVLRRCWVLLLLVLPALTACLPSLCRPCAPPSAGPGLMSSTFKSLGLGPKHDPSKREHDWSGEHWIDGTPVWVWPEVRDGGGHACGCGNEPALPCVLITDSPPPLRASSCTRAPGMTAPATPRSRCSGRWARPTSAGWRGAPLLALHSELLLAAPVAVRCGQVKGQPGAAERCTERCRHRAQPAPSAAGPPAPAPRSYHRFAASWWENDKTNDYISLNEPQLRQNLCGAAA